VTNFPFAKTVGLFIIVAGVSATAVLLGLGASRGWVTPRASVWAVFDEAQRMRTGDPVTLSGFQVGEVGSLSLTDDFRIVAELRIERRHLKHLSVKTVARAEPPLLLGPGEIRLRPDPTGAPLSPGDTLETEPTEDTQALVESVQGIMRKVDATMTNLQEVAASAAALTQGLAHPDSSFQRTVRAVAVLAEGLSEGEGLLPALLRSGSLTSRVDSTLAAAAVAARELHLLLNSVDHLVGSSDTLLVEAGSLTLLLEESATILNTELVPTLRELRLTLEKARSSWLLTGGGAQEKAKPGLWRISP
jgi:ABC-type transporter Mla subunit MlaD